MHSFHKKNIFEAYAYKLFLSDPGIPGVRSLGPDVSTTPCVDLTDVTLADEDTNSIFADNAKGAIQGNMAMQVMYTYASGAIWWPNLQLMQVAPSGGQICN